MEEDGGRREKVFSWRSSGIGLMCLCQEDRYPSTRGRGGTATSISMPLRLQTAKKMCDTKRGGQKSGKQRKVGERRRERKRGGEKGAVLGSGYRATEGGPNLDRRIPRTRALRPQANLVSGGAIPDTATRGHTSSPCLTSSTGSTDRRRGTRTLSQPRAQPRGTGT